jgi:putative tryptophan/tyrosine transport system substrate-binding protein
MKRREFIALVSGAAVVWPLATRAESPLPVIGYLYIGSQETSTHIQIAFKQGLGEAGYFEGRNVVIEYRWAHNDYARLPELVAELIHMHVAVIAAPSATSAARAARAATSTIPIVFSGGGDPVQAGLVASINHPGGNATGVGGMTEELGVKRLELLLDLLPNARRFVLLANPATMDQLFVDKLKAAASTSGGELEIQTAATPDEIDKVFAMMTQKRTDAVLVNPDTFFMNIRMQLAALAIRHALPAIFPFREDVQAGGLISYGPSITDNARLAGVYTGRILNGEKPADLPVLQPTKFDLAINLKTAKALGLTVPNTLLVQATEVIE